MCTTGQKVCDPLDSAWGDGARHLPTCAQMQDTIAAHHLHRGRKAAQTAQGAPHILTHLCRQPPTRAIRENRPCLYIPTHRHTPRMQQTCAVPLGMEAVAHSAASETDEASWGARSGVIGVFPISPLAATMRLRRGYFRQEEAD